MFQTAQEKQRVEAAFLGGFREGLKRVCRLWDSFTLCLASHCATETPGSAST
jgi:hypothetical protein